MSKDEIKGWASAAGFEAGFAPPATRAGIDDAERRLGHALPKDLVALLLESDGVRGDGLDLVWPLARIVEENLYFRASADFAALYMPFDALLFFADGGNGDQFAFVLRDGRRDVFVWNHEDDSRTWVAPYLPTFLEWWLDGRITV